jgi:hypothetical protein
VHRTRFIAVISMTISPSLPSLISSAAAPKGMHLRQDVAEPGWMFWERRTVNLHRVVGFAKLDHGLADARALDAALRGTLARNFKRAWWRGIAYGVVANIGAHTVAPDDLTILVDAVENSKGTMQWVILLADGTRQASGVHTWVEGFLSPVYRNLLGMLAEQGYRISSAMKEKTGLLKVLTAVADGESRALTGQNAFTTFRDPFMTQHAATSSPKSRTSS